MGNELEKAIGYLRRINSVGRYGATPRWDYVEALLAAAISSIQKVKDG